MEAFSILPNLLLCLADFVKLIVGNSQVYTRWLEKIFGLIMYPSLQFVNGGNPKIP
jgi:hypothetical protein